MSNNIFIVRSKEFAEQIKADYINLEYIIPKTMSFEDLNDKYVIIIVEVNADDFSDLWYGTSGKIVEIIEPQQLSAVLPKINKRFLSALIQYCDYHDLQVLKLLFDAVKPLYQDGKCKTIIYKLVTKIDCRFSREELDEVIDLAIQNKHDTLLLHILRRLCHIDNQQKIVNYVLKNYKNVGIRLLTEVCSYYVTDPNDCKTLLFQIAYLDTKGQYILKVLNNMKYISRPNDVYRTAFKIAEHYFLTNGDPNYCLDFLRNYHTYKLDEFKKRFENDPEFKSYYYGFYRIFRHHYD